jgi:hypothetical protein
MGALAGPRAALEKTSGYFASLYGSSDYSITHGIVVDSLNNVYTTGQWNYIDSNGRNQYDIFVAKYSSSGQLKWHRVLSSAFSSQSRNGSGWKIALDSSNDVIVTGQYSFNSIHPYIGAFVAKFNNSGILQWQRQLTIVNAISYKTNSYSYSVAIDSSNYIYITGAYANNSTGAVAVDIFTAKYNSSGTLQWQKSLNGPNAADLRQDWGNSIALDSSSNVFITGRFRNTSGGTNAFVAKYNSSGTLQWQKSINSPNSASSQYDIGYGIKVDQYGDIFVVGAFQKPTTSYTKGFLIKFDTSGSVVFQKEIGTSATNNGLILNNLFIDSTGKIQVVGLEPTSSLSFGFLIKLDTSQNIDIQKMLSSSVDSGNVSIEDISFDSKNNSIVSGFFGSTGNVLYGLNAKLPSDNTTNGTYTVTPPGKRIAYSTSTLVSIANSSLTIATSSLTDTTATLTDASASLIDSAGSLNYGIVYM